jgi:serine/threonine protein kinase
MELCSGGDLYTRLPYSEREAAEITAKLCSAIAYMHSRDVVHRDCKLTFVP